MPRITKVLNSSVVLAADKPGGQEYIVLQKGVGYGRKPGQEIEVLKEGRVFLPASGADYNQLLELLEKIPAVYPEITREIILYAQEQMHTSLNEHIYLALTDHLHFAVERYRKHIEIVNRVLWELKTFYPKEYEIGLYALDLVEKRLGVRLPDAEAANVAFHIVNAQKENEQYDAMRAAKLIGRVQTIITYYMNCQPDKTSLHYSRFVSHMQYFAERLFSDKLLSSEDDFLYHQMREAYPRALSCAERVRTLIRQEYQKELPNEEVAYLTIHIQRLITRD
ncbi:MAG: PRD domain-containing protein [Lachnospiraceae bacterium]|nr:PRD domain-containing protein [Lachnospiraceae bacterium]